MKNTLIVLFIISIIVIPMVFLLPYLSVFNSNLSLNHSDWGSFGSYFAGTIGSCFYLLSIVLLYLTFSNQRKQQFENAFQQYISNYYSLLNLIKERWLHIASYNGRPIYQKGREIFGNAVGYIDIDNEEKKFIEIFNIHNNVFQHYCTYLIVLFEIIENNNDLNKKTKNKYINRFLSMLSTYELTFFAYFIKYQYKNENSKKILHYLQKIFKKLKLKDEFPYKEQIQFIINELDKINCTGANFAYFIKYLYTDKNSKKILHYLQKIFENLKLKDKFPHIKMIQFIIKELNKINCTGANNVYEK